MKKITKINILIVMVFIITGCSASMGKMDCYTNNNGDKSQTICH